MQNFSVNVRSSHAKSFNSELVELPIAPLLWPLMSKHGAGIPQPLLLVVEQPVLICGSHTPGGTFRTQTDIITISIVETVHFLFNDISDFPDRTFKDLSPFYYGKPNFPITEPLDDTLKSRFQVLPTQRLIRKRVTHSPNCLKFCHIKTLPELTTRKQ